MSQLCLVADDITGALDSAVAFCGQYGAIPVYQLFASGTSQPCIAIDTETREADVDEASRATEQIVPDLARARIAYLKVDSSLRGPWATELACVMNSGEFSTCIFAPAFPQQGRFTRQGRQWVQGMDGVLSVLPIKPAEALGNSGLKHRLVPSPSKSLVGLSAEANEVLLFDASTVSDLAAVARWGRSLRQRPLWCGSAGLARVLADRVPPSAVPAVGPILVIVGSNHPVARAQVEYLLKQYKAEHVVVGAGAVGCIGMISASLQSGKNSLLTFGFPSSFDKQTAAMTIRDKLRQILPAIHQPGSLLVTGGETLRSVLLAVSASHLEVDSEVVAGVPHAVLRGGQWEGMGSVSKSGSFGTPTWLADYLVRRDQSACQDSGR